MPDWTKSMEQSYEYFIVDPGTWKDKTRLANVTKSSINRDATVETLGSATFDITESLGECYIRVYLVTIQNGIKERHALGTFLIQTPKSTFNGMIRSVSIDAYTPLLELKENPPPLGYSILKGENIMDNAYRLVGEHARAPVVGTECTETLYSDFIANTDDTWISFIRDLTSNAKYQIGLDEIGRILFLPVQETASLQPVWTYTDDNASILQAEMEMDHDLYGIPNVVEVIYSNGMENFYGKAVNNDENSPISVPNRGREIIYRDTNPGLVGSPNAEMVQEYAEKLLRELSTVEYTITYTHGYCPVRLGDCVRFDCEKAGLTNIKAKVISQNISCTPGCQVKEKAVFTNKLWR